MAGDIGVRRGVGGPEQSAHHNIEVLQVLAGCAVDGRPCRRCDTSGPEEKRDHHCHCASDGNILDANQAHVPTAGLENVEHGDHQHRERGLTGGKGEDLGNVGGSESCKRKQNPQQGAVGTQHDDDGSADDKPRGGSRNRPYDFRARGQGTAAQNRHRAQHHPEPVLHRHHLNEGHCGSEAHTGAQCVAGDHRPGYDDRGRGFSGGLEFGQHEICCAGRWQLPAQHLGDHRPRIGSRRPRDGPPDETHCCADGVNREQSGARGLRLGLARFGDNLFDVVTESVSQHRGQVRCCADESLPIQVIVFC